MAQTKKESDPMVDAISVDVLLTLCLSLLSSIHQSIINNPFRYLGRLLDYIVSSTNFFWFRKNFYKTFKARPIRTRLTIRPMSVSSVFFFFVHLGHFSMRRRISIRRCDPKSVTPSVRPLRLFSERPPGRRIVCRVSELVFWEYAFSTRRCVRPYSVGLFLFIFFLCSI